MAILRQYVVTYEATDDNGNTAVAQRIVIVGRERG